MDYTISISYILEKKIHVLTEVITERSRAMAIEAVVFVFEIV